MNSRMTMAFVSLFVASEIASACGGGSSSLARGGRFATGSSGLVRSPISSPLVSSVTAQSMRMNMARQAAIAQARAYHAQMRPIRIEKANRMREQKIAQREARAQIRIAKLEENKRKQQEFLADARTWTDSTGKHTLVAILEDANGWGVKLRKQDGGHVNVPHKRLSSSDRAWVAYEIEKADRDNRFMIAGL